MGGGPCDYCVSPSSKNWVFGLFRLSLNEGQNLGHGIWDLDLGLTVNVQREMKSKSPRVDIDNWLLII